MPKLPIAPRKRPRQERSKETVKAILEAAARILDEQGYDALTTNQIARRAGVSPGSLYQYFPNKDAVVAALIDSLSEQYQEFLSKRLAEVMSAPLPEAAEKMMRALVEAIRTVNPVLVRNLLEQLPRLGKNDAVMRVRSRGFELARAYLKVHARELVVPDVEMAAFFTTSIAEQLVLRIAFNRPQRLSLERCLGEAQILLVGYLTGAPR